MTQSRYSPPRTDGQTPSTLETAKTEVAEVGRSAATRAGDVAGTAGEQVKQVASEAGAQARNLLDEGAQQLRDQASNGQQKLAEGVRDVAGQLRRMSEQGQDSGLVSDVARQAGDRAERLASWLESREPGDVVAEVRRFARRRPGMFLAGAAVAGVLAGRLTRNLASAAPEAQPQRSENGSGWRAERPTAVATPDLAPGGAAYPPVEQLEAGRVEPMSSRPAVPSAGPTTPLDRPGPGQVR